MPFFSKVFKHKEGPRSASKAGKYADEHDGGAVAPPKPRWEDAWSRKDVAPEEVQELIHVCTQEMKSRALDMPFLLLPFRPNSDPTAARSFIRNFFRAQADGSAHYTGEGLQQELMLTEPMVLCSIMKWCWSRLPGGVVTWDAYELFRIGEQDSDMARHAFDTFIPLSVDSEHRKQIIFDFFDLLAAVAARGRTNGLGGRKLSRMAGWWAFELSDQGKGFDGGYKSWASAADATSHLFFAYLRSLSPDSQEISGINTLPRSLQALVSQTEYPPEAPALMLTRTTKVVMIVDSVSPTPFALLRRAKHFEYRDDDEALQEFAYYDDPVQALTDECRRVLNAISSTNQSTVAPEAGLPEWSRFEDLGFSAVLGGMDTQSTNGSVFSGYSTGLQGLRTAPRSRTTDLGRPTTPSWADFLSSGFTDENGNAAPSPLLLPPDKILPPIGEAARVQSSQSHMRNGQDDNLEPGELASITQFDLDETFWWVWMTSLAGEEPSERKAVFGRCAVIETQIAGARWLVMEEQVKGASPGPEEGAYIAEKKGRFTFTKRGRLGRRKSTGKKTPLPTPDPYSRGNANTPMSKTSIGPDQHARIHAAAAQLAQKQKAQTEQGAQRRGRADETISMKTNSVMTLQPGVLSEAGPAMKWAKEFDKGTIRAKYLGDPNAGKGMAPTSSTNDLAATANGAGPSPLPKEVSNRDLPALPASPAPEPIPRKEVQPAMDVPSPAPLPATPSLSVMESKKAEASAAAEVPLPASTPYDEKPKPPVMDQSDQHPAFRKPVPHPEERVSTPEPSPAEEAARRAWENQPRPQEQHAPPASPEATKKPSPKKPSPKKLHKTTTGGGGGGFRKFFGRKKAGAQDRSGTPEPPKENEATRVVPQGTVGRRMSALRKKTSPANEDASLEPPVDKAATVVSQSPAMEPSPAVAAVSNGHDAERDVHTDSRINTADQRDADHEFSRFDQGPMDDVPAFVPEDSDDEYDASHAASVPHPHGGDRDPYQTGVAPPEIDPSADDVSEASIDLARQVSPSQDRWAQIRKNAAERAARMSEEQSRRSQSQSARTDEGETSGEETIESRVARIKARVAELTGNMDGQGSSQPGLRR